MILATTKTRLLQYLETKGINKSEFYKITGMKRGLIDGDKLSATVADTSIAKILEKFPDLNIEWLITGEGDMFRNLNANYTNISKTPLQVSDKSGSYHTKSHQVPLYEPKAGRFASLLNGAEPQQPAEYVSIPDMPMVDGAMRVKGESMSPILQSGDIVIYKVIEDTSSELLWGEIYIVIFDQGGNEYAGINYVNKSENKGFIILEGYNSKYAPKEIPISQIKAMALVKASIRYNTMG